jgi:hypothetical protein
VVASSIVMKFQTSRDALVTQLQATARGYRLRPGRTVTVRVALNRSGRRRVARKRRLAIRARTWTTQPPAASTAAVTRARVLVLRNPRRR